MRKILRKHQYKMSYRWAMINWNLLNIDLYIQPLEACLAFSCLSILCPWISCQATSGPANLSKFVLHFHVRKFHAWTLGPSISRLSNSCLDILIIRHDHVRHFQRPLLQTQLNSRFISFHFCRFAHAFKPIILSNRIKTHTDFRYSK